MSRRPQGMPPQQAMSPPSANARQNEYFLPRDGIDREVITADICRYLGNDALVRPGTYENPQTRQTKQGYFITAYRNLTSAMIDDLKADSARWEQERRAQAQHPHMRSGAPNHYQQSNTHARRQQTGPSGNPYDDMNHDPYAPKYPGSDAPGYSGSSGGGARPMANSAYNPNPGAGYASGPGPNSYNQGGYPGQGGQYPPQQDRYGAPNQPMGGYGQQQQDPPYVEVGANRLPMNPSGPYRDQPSYGAATGGHVMTSGPPPSSGYAAPPQHHTGGYPNSGYYQPQVNPGYQQPMAQPQDAFYGRSGGGRTTSPPGAKGGADRYPPPPPSGHAGPSGHPGHVPQTSPSPYEPSSQYEDTAMRDAPMRDAPMRDAPGRDAPMRDTTSHGPMRDAPMRAPVPPREATMRSPVQSNSAGAPHRPEEKSSRHQEKYRSGSSRR